MVALVRLSCRVSVNLDYELSLVIYKPEVYRRHMQMLSNNLKETVRLKWARLKPIFKPLSGFSSWVQDKVLRLKEQISKLLSKLRNKDKQPPQDSAG